MAIFVTFSKPSFVSLRGCTAVDDIFQDEVFTIKLIRLLIRVADKLKHFFFKDILVTRGISVYYNPLVKSSNIRKVYWVCQKKSLACKVFAQHEQ